MVDDSQARPSQCSRDGERLSRKLPWDPICSTSVSAHSRHSLLIPRNANAAFKSVLEISVSAFLSYSSRTMGQSMQLL